MSNCMSGNEYLPKSNGCMVTHHSAWQLECEADVWGGAAIVPWGHGRLMRVSSWGHHYDRLRLGSRHVRLRGSWHGRTPWGQDI